MPLAATYLPEWYGNECRSSGKPLVRFWYHTAVPFLSICFTSELNTALTVRNRKQSSRSRHLRPLHYLETGICSILVRICSPAVLCLFLCPSDCLILLLCTQCCPCSRSQLGIIHTPRTASRLGSGMAQTGRRPRITNTVRVLAHRHYWRMGTVHSPGE
ncbi:hypothetical protein B0H65DRAFT_455861 [Neurospora tetraspora]|uniref:Uncharacterized protein n=1 Tax=Neurospora tetraspora TaxID=94610 RepID=A0AAE0MTV1_9PEZI|nr:hypothetical protein B0H65DRAFT_455861 [Neurospora tetraspora]